MCELLAMSCLYPARFTSSLTALASVSSFLYADGDVLFAHADRHIQPLTGLVTAPALYRLECPAGDKATLVHDGVPTAQRVVLIASVPLTHESWTPMPQGEVIAVRHGEIVATRLLSESTSATV